MSRKNILSVNKQTGASARDDNFNTPVVKPGLTWTGLKDKVRKYKGETRGTNDGNFCHALYITCVITTCHAKALSQFCLKNFVNKVKEKHDSKEQKCFLLKDAASDLHFFSSIFKNSTCLWPELHDTRLLPERQWRSQRR